MIVAAMNCFNHNRRLRIVFDGNVGPVKQGSASVAWLYASFKVRMGFRRLGAGVLYQTQLALFPSLLPSCHCVDVYRISLMNFSTAREAAVNGCSLDVAIQVVCSTLGLHR